AGPRWHGITCWMIGFFATYHWLKTKVARSDAAFGAFSLALSFGMLWRMVAEHMLFLLEMMLPFFLLSIERIEKAETVRVRAAWTLLLSLGGAFMIYEPGFHALFYFVLPGIFFDLVLRAVKSPSSMKKLLPFLITAGVLAVLMILSKI